MNLHLNSSLRRGVPLVAADCSMFGPSVVQEVRSFMAPLGYARTRLRAMPALAERAGVQMLLLKDESSRSPLGSFKALGGAYAVIRLVLAEAERALGRACPPTVVQSANVRSVAERITVTCATDGNHGRSVAAGARLSGCRAVIFVHEHVSLARVRAIEELGAQVTRVRGTYDDSVAEAARAAQENGWIVVSDTSWPGYEDIPARVMQGYVLMVDEAVQQWKELGVIPSHVFLQAGVGGFAAAVAAHLHLRLADCSPRFVVVEPERAACLFASARAHALRRIEPGEPTIMAMLECYEPSLIAWRVLERLAHAFVTIDDAAAVRAMRCLAAPPAGDPAVVSGESGGAGVAALLEAADDEPTRRALGLDRDSVVLAFNTEGATDRALYESLVANAGDRHVRC